MIHSTDTQHNKVTTTSILYPYKPTAASTSIEWTKGSPPKLKCQFIKGKNISPPALPTVSMATIPISKVSSQKSPSPTQQLPPISSSKKTKVQDAPLTMTLEEVVTQISDLPEITTTQEQRIRENKEKRITTRVDDNGKKTSLNATETLKLRISKKHSKSKSLISPTKNLPKHKKSKKRKLSPTVTIATQKKSPAKKNKKKDRNKGATPKSKPNRNVQAYSPSHQKFVELSLTPDIGILTLHPLFALLQARGIKWHDTRGTKLMNPNIWTVIHVSKISESAWKSWRNERMEWYDTEALDTLLAADTWLSKEFGFPLYSKKKDKKRNKCHRRFDD